MIATFPRRGHWITLQLAAADTHPDAVLLVELAGACSGDPDAERIRVTHCPTAQDAHAHAKARLTAGWAAHASADRPADRGSAAAALHAADWTPPATPTDRACA